MTIRVSATKRGAVMTVGTVTDANTNGANTKAAAGDRFRFTIAAQLAGTKIAASATIGGAGKFVRSGSAADLNGRPTTTYGRLNAFEAAIRCGGYFFKSDIQCPSVRRTMSEPQALRVRVKLPTRPRARFIIDKDRNSRPLINIIKLVADLMRIIMQLRGHKIKYEPCACGIFFENSTKRGQFANVSADFSRISTYLETCL